LSRKCRAASPLPPAAISSTARMINRLRMSPHGVFQQPDADPVPVKPLLPRDIDVPVEPVRPEVPVARLEVPVTVEPVHGVTGLGSGMPIIGLTPRLPISVEPRGMVPPLRVDVAPVPGLASGDAVPLDEIAPDEAEAHVDVVVVPGIEVVGDIALVPPPSKVELVPAVPDPVVPAVVIPGNDEPVPTQFAPLPDDPIGAGLRPPGSSSVAPSGIPVGELDDVEPRVPNGDVAPMAGAVIGLCARLASQLTTSAIAATNTRRIEASSRATSRRKLSAIRMARGCCGLLDTR
jgi:hypothetical protein